MSIHCINPEVFQGDPRGAPEYESDNFELCERCKDEIDLDDDKYEYTSTGYIHQDCVSYCDICDKSLDDTLDSKYWIYIPQIDIIAAHPECLGDAILDGGFKE